MEQLIKQIRSCGKAYHKPNGEFVTNIQTLKEFLKTHLVVKKGEHRHPSADLLHKWLETDEQLQFREMGEKWIDIDLVRKFEYKIKEPLFEYQLLEYSNNCQTLGYGEYETIEEAVWRCGI